MATQTYDPIGAMGGLFAPAYIVNDPVSEAAVAAWNAAHLKTRPQHVYNVPVTASADQRDAIAQQLVQNAYSGPGSYVTPDAGGLGLGIGSPADTTTGSGGGSTTSDPAAGGRASVADAVEAGNRGDNSVQNPNAYADPNPDQQAPAPTTSTPSTPIDPNVNVNAVPATGTTNNAAVQAAKDDAKAANEDPVQGPTGPQGPQGTPNLGYDIGKGYGYGINPSKGGAPTPVDPPDAPQAPTAPAAPGGATTASIGPALDDTFAGGAPTGLGGMGMGIGFGGSGPGGVGAPALGLDPNDAMAVAVDPGGHAVSAPGNQAATAMALGGYGGKGGLGATAAGWGGTPNIGPNPDAPVATVGTPIDVTPDALETGVGTVGAPGSGMQGIDAVADGVTGGGGAFGGGFDGLGGGNVGDVGNGLGSAGVGASGVAVGGNQAAVDTAMGNIGTGGSGLGLGGSGGGYGDGMGGASSALGGGQAGGNAAAIDAAMQGFGW